MSVRFGSRRVWGRGRSLRNVDRNRVLSDAEYFIHIESWKVRSSKEIIHDCGVKVMVIAGQAISKFTYYFESNVKFVVKGRRLRWRRSRGGWRSRCSGDRHRGRRSGNGCIRSWARGKTGWGIRGGGWSRRGSRVN